MNYLSVCSGIEAASVAWEPLGWKPTAFSEIDPFPCSVLAHHYPNIQNLGDMTKYEDWQIKEKEIDILVGGTPCTAFSVAGLRKGLSDPNGNLALVYCGIADKFKPKWILWENVPGVLSSSKGRDFGAFLGALGEIGYGYAYRVLDAQFCRSYSHPRAVPQRRRRCFLIGYLGDWRPPAAVLFEQKSLSWDPPPCRKAQQNSSSNVKRSIGVESENSIAACLRSGGAGGLPSSRGEHLVIEESNAKINLNSQDIGVFTSSSFGGYSEKEVPGTLRAHGGDLGGGSESLIVKNEYSQAIPIHTQALQGSGWRVCSNKQDGRGNGLGVGKHGDPCPTLSTGSVHAVAVDVYNQTVTGDIAVTVTAAVGGTNTSGPKVAQEYKNTMAVRKLTPLECERLQGFPDNWTKVEWKGKKETPDGVRYKAIGNSMPVNCMNWIGERIKRVEEIVKKRI